jgi:hypothetical protein
MQPVPDAEPLALKEAVAFATRRFTQKRIEALTGIDQGRLSKIMNPIRPERPTLSEIARLEDAVGRRRGYILTLAGYVSNDGSRQAWRDAGAEDLDGFRSAWAARGKPAKPRARGRTTAKRAKAAAKPVRTTKKAAKSAKRTAARGGLKRAATGGRTTGRRSKATTRPSAGRRRET